MAAEVIALLDSDSEGDDPASLAAWQQQDPNAVGGSAFEAIDLGSDSGGEDSYPDADASEEVSNGRMLDAEGAASGVVNSPSNIGKYRSTSSSGAANGNGGDGSGASDVRSDDSSSSSSSSGSSSSSSGKAHEGASELLVGVPSIALAAGGNRIVTETPAGRQQVVEEALSEISTSADSRRDGQDALNCDCKQVSGNGDGGAASSANADASRTTSSNEASNVAKEVEACGAPVSASAATSASRSPDPEKSPAAGVGGGVVAVTGKGTLPGSASTSSLAAQDVESSDAWVGPNEIASGNVAVGISDNSPAPSGASASSSLPALSAEVTADSVQAIIEALPPGFVRCPGCPMVYELVPNEAVARGGGGGLAAKELPKGANLSRRSAMRHNGRHRFRCPSCSTCFCGSCRATPYHIGFDCEGWMAYQAKPKCTFCGDAAEEEGDAFGSGDDDGDTDGKGEADGLKAPPCCGGEECRARANEGCRKKLKCGHPCRGPSAAECLPCIETGCPSAEVDGDDFCNVCWTESLLAAPCVKLECSHFVHVSCGREQLKRGRPTARLTFGFMSCPVCRADKVLATHPHLGKCEGIHEQLALAHEVEELAIQRLRADELPPLQRSSLESLHAGMRRRMAGLRHRQMDGNPAHWRGRGRGGPFPLQMPYPPMHVGYQPLRRPRGAGAAAAGGGGGEAAAGARAHPMFPIPLVQAGAAPVGDWQALAGMGMDWGVPPFMPMMPPPYALNNVPRAARRRPRAAAEVEAGAEGAEAAAQGSPPGAGGSRHQPVSQEEYLDRKRQMLIAQADVAMKRAVAVGARVPGRAARGVPSAGDIPAARGRSPLVRERLEQQLEKGKAFLEERRRARRDARKLDDWPLSDEIPHRSRRSRASARVAVSAGDAGDNGGAGAGVVATGDDGSAPGATAVDENPGGRQDSAKQPWGRLLLSRSGDGDPVPKLDAGEQRARLPGAAARALPSRPPPPPVRLSMGPQVMGADRQETAQGGQREKKGQVDAGGGDGKEAIGVWGWDGVVDGGAAAAAAAAAEASGQRPEGSGISRRVRKEAPGGNDVRENFKMAKHDISAKGEAKNDSGNDEPGGVKDENGYRDSAGSAWDGLADAHAHGEKEQQGDNVGHVGAADNWFGALPWPLRALSGKSRRKVARETKADNGDVQNDAVGLNEVDLVFPSPLNKRRKGGVGSGNVSLGGGIGAGAGAGAGAGDDANAGGPSIGPEAQRDGDDALSATIADGEDEPHAVKRPAPKRCAGGSSAHAGDAPEPPSKRVHFGNGGVGVGRARRGVWSVEDEWLDLHGPPALSRRDKQEEKEAAVAVVDAVIAAGGDGAGRDGSVLDIQRGGEKIDLAAAGMLRLHVSSAAKAKSRNARVAAAAAAAMSGAAPSRDRADPARPSGTPAAAAAAAAAAAPKADGAKNRKRAEGDAASAGGGDASSPALEQSKEERADLVKRALKKYSYYQCHSCRKPYFGGLVNCEPAAPPAAGGGGGAAGGGAVGEADAAERALASIKPEELLCGKCSAGSGGANCSEHGQEFMEHKCYWCCRKVASYFCGGVMHFCDVCHLHGFAAKPKPCLGGARCLFGGQHPDKANNGENEFVLGCGICRPKPEEAEEGGQ